MAARKKEKVPVKDPEEVVQGVAGKRKRKTDQGGIEQWIGVANPRTPHPGDIDQPMHHNFNYADLGEIPEGENFDRFDISREVRRRGGSTCNSVLVMKHKKPLPMWFDEYLCPRVMHGKWCGYVAYAFRRRIKIGSWPRWTNVPKHVKDEAWEDVLSSWDFRTVLTKEEHAKLKKQWTTYASDKMRCWRSCQFKKYILDVEDKKRTAEEVGHPCDQYRWLDPKEWDLFVQFRSTDKFRALSKKNSKNANKKQYTHHTGSGGYRLIYIRKAKEMREQAIDQKIDEGMSREEAEEAVRDMVFRVDRSIVFLEANKDKDGNYSDTFVKDLAQKILDMNKEKEEGTLIIEGKEDILIKVAGKDPWGRYRACPSTAKLDFAMPEYAEQKKQKRRAARRTKKEKEEMMATKVKDYNKYGEWIARNIGVQLSEDISPEQFLKEQQDKGIASNSATPHEAEQPKPEEDIDESDDEDETPMPCWLKALNIGGETVTVAAGVVFPAGKGAKGFQTVQIRPPILLPRNCLPLPTENHTDVGSALGVALMWPEDLIDYDMEKQQMDSEESSQDTESDCHMEDVDCPAKEHSQPTDKDMSKCSMEINEIVTDVSVPELPQHILTVPDLEMHDDQNSPPTADASLSVQEFHWDFSHHNRDPEVRMEVREALKNLQAHPNSKIMYSIPLRDLIFGPRVKHMTLKMEEATTWINNIDGFRKQWISNWQMDLFASLMHIKMTDEDLERVQIISAASTFNNHKDEVAGAAFFQDAVMEVLKAKRARLYVMPILRGDHWMFFIISPEESTIYCIDPLAIGLRQNKETYFYNLLISLGSKYDEVIRPKDGSSTPPKSWNIVNLFHKKQPYRWECGYYTMLYMEKIILLHKGVDVKSVFPEDFTPYPISVIEGLIDTNCIFYRDAIVPACTVLHGKPKGRPRKPRQT